MRRQLCIWLPDWPIQRQRHLVVTGPVDAIPADQETSETAQALVQSQGRVVVLWRKDPRRGRIVVARCSRAESLGVRLGASIAEATDFLRRGCQEESPGLAPLVEEHDRQADLQAISRLAEAFQESLCPLVSLETLDPFTWAGRTLHLPEALWCDLTGSAHLHGGEAGVIAAAQATLAAQNLQGHLAIADTLGAAWAIANCSGDRATVVPRGEVRRAISALPCRGLRISPETVATLARLGVETIGQVLQFPKSGLASRLGTHLVRRIDEALGDADEYASVHHSTQEDSASMELEYPTDDWPILRDRIGKLCEEVRLGLAARDCGALHVRCHLELTLHPPLSLEVGLFAPTLDVVHWMQLIERVIEAKRLASPVHRIVLSVTHAEPLSTTQGSLLGETPASRANDLAKLVDSLSSRLGRKRVCGVRTTADPLPENAFLSFPLAGHSKWRKNASANPSRDQGRSAKSMGENVGHVPQKLSGVLDASSPCFAPAKGGPVKGAPVKGGPTKGPPAPASNPFAADLANHDWLIPREISLPDHATNPGFPCPDDVMRRPLLLLSQPRPLRAYWRSENPEGPLRIPDGFRYAGQKHELIRHWGPERIETGWWKGASARRDYFRVETSRGQWWWVFRDFSRRDGSSASWNLHGFFG